ncbi:MAG: hypothetical protein MJZ30_06255 [Paludibacteraceae bacterium]|nr:hypothetical protein [Paludibacteraceae bacterium]
MDEKKELTQDELVEQTNDVLSDLKEKLSGIEREVVNFKIRIREDFAIEAVDEDGFTVVYPMLKKSGLYSINITWYFVASWLVTWDEESRNAIAGYLGRVVYPCAMAMSFDDRENLVNKINKAVSEALDVQGNPVETDSGTSE